MNYQINGQSVFENNPSPYQDPIIQTQYTLDTEYFFEVLSHFVPEPHCTITAPFGIISIYKLPNFGTLLCRCLYSCGISITGPRFPRSSSPDFIVSYFQAINDYTFEQLYKDMHSLYAYINKKDEWDFARACYRIYNLSKLLSDTYRGDDSMPPEGEIFNYLEAVMCTFEEHVRDWEEVENDVGFVICEIEENVHLSE